MKVKIKMRFEKKEDCFLDTETGLEWELIQSEEKLNYEDGIRYCESLGSEWRLPTIKELFPLMEFEKQSPATDLPDTKSSYYWSSTTGAGNTGSAWLVNFSYGNVGNGNKSSSYYVRAVRGEQKKMIQNEDNYKLELNWDKEKMDNAEIKVGGLENEVVNDTPNSHGIKDLFYCSNPIIKFENGKTNLYPGEEVIKKLKQDKDSCELCGKPYEIMKYLDQCPECGRIQRHKYRGNSVFSSTTAKDLEDCGLKYEEQIEKEKIISEKVKRKEIEEKYKLIEERIFEKKKQIEKESKVKEISQGPKFDFGKARFDLIPPYPLWELAKIFNIGGGIKYPEHSWEKGILFSRIYGALQRHINLFWSGESLDPEDGLHHLAHAMWCLAVLMEYEKNFGDKFDDRSFSLPENYKKTFSKEDLKRSGE